MDLFSIPHLIVIILLLGIPILIIYFIYRCSKSNKENIIKNRTASFSTADEIEKLFSLKEKGAITLEEFEERKSKLL